MQKKIIALAVAALASSAAFAQSNVTIYGVADAFVGSFKTDDAKRSTQVNSGGLAASRIGFKGVEDLGNGLKALFVLEYRLDLDQNEGVGSWNSGVGTPVAASAGPARQQMVGLTGGFGTAVAGRLQTTAYDWAVSYDILAGTAISPLQAVNTVTANGGAGFIVGGSTIGARANNAVAYISPSFGGLTVAYNRAYLSEQTAATGGQANYDDTQIANMLSVNYKNGPIAAGIVYSNVNDKTAFNPVPVLSATTKTTDWALGGSYDLGVAKLTATYQTTKSKGDAAGVGFSLNKDKAYSLGVAVPVTAAGTVIASYAKNNIASTFGAGFDDDNTKSYTVAYTHAMSKRTKLYAGYQAINRGNDRVVAVAGVANAGGRDTTALVGGINHSF